MKKNKKNNGKKSFKESLIQLPKKIKNSIVSFPGRFVRFIKSVAGKISSFFKHIWYLISHPTEIPGRAKKSITKYFKTSSKMSVFTDFLVAAVVIIMLCFSVNPISGTSMYPTYDDGEYAIGTRIKFSLERGDVVIAYEESKNELIIKRIAGIPGDELVISTDGNLYVNGEEYTYGVGKLYLDWYLYSDELAADENGNLCITLGKNEYFLVGDNHENSLDSRYYGTFKKYSIISKILIVIDPDDI